MRLILTVTTLCLSLSACWVPIEQGRAMEADIVRLKADMSDQRRLAEENATRAERDRALAAQEQARLEAKTQEVTQALEQINHLSRKTGADLSVELADALGEIARLRGLIEEVQARQATMEETSQTLRDELDKRPEASQEQAKNTTAQPPPAALPTGKEDFYAFAREKLENKEHPEARRLFAEFLQKWPKDALAANAQYWIAESFYAEKKYREAILDFRKVNEKYPKSDKAPDSLLKIGYSFAALGLKDEARLFLDEVIRAHPKSQAAKLAQAKKTELK